MRRVFGKHLIRGLDQDVRVLGLEHEIWIELFHDVIKPAMAARAFDLGQQKSVIVSEHR